MSLYRPKFALFFLSFAIIISACARAERHERSLWYVTTTGSDSNPCTESLPCLTLVEAVARADADDKIIIAAGTYHEVDPLLRADYYIFPVEFNLWIEGAGRDTTIIDLGNLYAGFYVRGEGRLRLEGLTVQNARGNSPGGVYISLNPPLPRSLM